MHARVAGEPAPSFLNKSRLPAKLAEAQAAVKKAQIRAQALASMDQAIKDGASSRVYDARDDLVEQYADLARDKDLVTSHDLGERADPQGRHDRADPPAGRTRQPRPMRWDRPAAWSSALTSDDCRLRRPRRSSMPWPMAMATLCMVCNGTPLWNRPLGLAAPFAPQPVPGDATVVAIDARFNELVRLDARTGELKWRLALGEPVADPPLVLGNQLAQVIAQRKTAVDRARVGRARVDGEPGAAAGSIASK